jgi:hypothetical protein
MKGKRKDGGYVRDSKEAFISKQEAIERKRMQINLLQGLIEEWELMEYTDKRADYIRHLRTRLGNAKNHLKAMGYCAEDWRMPA